MESVMKNVSDLLKIIAAILAVSGTMIGAYYILTNALYENLQILKPCPNDLMRLKFNLNSPDELKTNTFYLTIFIIFISTAISILQKNVLYFFVILLIFLSYIHMIEKKRMKEF